MMARVSKSKQRFDRRQFGGLHRHVISSREVSARRVVLRGNDRGAGRYRDAFIRDPCEPRVARAAAAAAQRPLPLPFFKPLSFKHCLNGFFRLTLHLPECGLHIAV